MGPPAKPPATMPDMAAAIATLSADGTPAAANCGAKASAVAGPPVSAVELMSTPSSGGSPKALTMAIPTTPCRIARKAANARNSSAWPLPERSSERLALKPIEVKKAVINAGCKEVSSVTVIPLLRRRARMAKATNRPPITAAGTL